MQNAWCRGTVGTSKHQLGESQYAEWFRCIQVDDLERAFDGVRIDGDPRWSGTCEVDERVVTVTTTGSATVDAIATTDTEDLDDQPWHAAGALDRLCAEATLSASQTSSTLRIPRARAIESISASAQLASPRRRADGVMPKPMCPICPRILARLHPPTIRRSRTPRDALPAG